MIHMLYKKSHMIQDILWNVVKIQNFCRRHFLSSWKQGIKIKVAYWISSNIAISILDFSLLLPFSYRSSNFAIAKLSLLIPLLQFLYKFCRLVHVHCFPYSYRSSNYCDSNSCRSFTLLKALARVKVHTSLSPSRARRSNNFTFTLRYRNIG